MNDYTGFTFPSDEDEIVITREWMFQNRTARGGWTDAQLAVLGIQKFKNAGWLDRVVGMRLTAEQAAHFKAAAQVYK